MLITSRVCVASCWSPCFILSASHRGTGWELPSPEAPSKVPVARSDSTDRSVLPLAFSFHPLAMSLILGIDPDSLLQGGWQLAPGGLKT